MKTQNVDENYLKDEVYQPWPELTEEERKDMETRYLAFLPRFKNKDEKFLYGGSCKCPMDILHDYILKGHKANIVSVQKTETTMSIRERQKQADYIYRQPRSTNRIIEDIDVKALLIRNRERLSQIFKLNF